MARNYTPEQLAKFEQMARDAGEAWQDMQTAIESGEVEQNQFDKVCLWYANWYLKAGHTNMGRNMVARGTDVLAAAVVPGQAGG